MRKILIVDDEDALRESYEMILNTEPYQVDVAKNGQVALEFTEKKEYDLILLDLMMPILDGLGFLKKVEKKHSKIIILSNLSSGIEIDKAYKLGADSSVLKATLSPKELLSLVRYEISAVAEA